MLKVIVVPSQTTCGYVLLLYIYILVSVYKVCDRLFTNTHKYLKMAVKTIRLMRVTQCHS